MGRTHRLAGLAGETWAALGLAGVVLAASLGGNRAGDIRSAPATQVGYHQPTTPQPQSEAPPSVAPQPENPDGLVVVFLRDGRRLEGRLVSRNNAKVVVEIAGFPTTFNMQDVLRIDPVPPVAERYRQLRTVIADDDIEQLLLLTDWLRDREAFSLALVEVAHILKLDPHNEEAKALKQQIESTILLRAEALNRAEDAAPGTDHKPRTKPKRRPGFPTLTRDQINLIKIYEVDLKDPPRLVVDRDTIRRLVEAYDGNDLIPQSREARAALERRPPVYILELMFRLRAREFYNEVRVDGEPKAFRLFRENVHRPWLVPTCSSTACHGGQQAGNLWLKNTSPNNEQTIYTNFLILDRYRLADGTPLIDYKEPAKSPLLQMALPRDLSLYPHPLVATNSTSVWRPVIGSTDDLRFAKAIQWINAMYQPRPEYPVTYEPPRPTDGVPVLPDDPIGER